MYIEDAAALEALVAQLRGVARVAVDTEFVGEDSYTPSLEIIQIGTETVEAIVDFRVLGSLGGLSEILLDPNIEKVMHAGSQDLAIFALLLGEPPRPVFDTQVAASMVGYGAQIAYSALVQR